MWRGLDLLGIAVAAAAADTDLVCVEQCSLNGEKIPIRLCSIVQGLCELPMSLPVGGARQFSCHALGSERNKREGWGGGHCWLEVLAQVGKRKLTHLFCT